MLPPTDTPNSEARHDAVRDEIAAAMGQVNAATVRLLEAVEVVLDETHWGGVGLKSPAHFLAWRTGLAPGHCEDLVRIAKRRHDLPCMYAAVKAGRLTLDQAAIVARHVPAAYDESVTEFARFATVTQLRTALPGYGFEAKKPKPSNGICTGNDDDGWWIRGRASAEQGAVIDQALAATREDLYQQHRAEAAKGEGVAPVSNSDALTAIAETALRTGEAARPGSDRYKVHVHLEQGPDGDYALSTTMGTPLPAPFRRALLCDCTTQALVRTGLSDLSVGRATHAISRKLRRAILHRDKGCRIPGCTTSVGHEIHHIVHWEDGGPTDTANLITLCYRHHQMHHEGGLGIAGTATDLTITDKWGHVVEPVGTNQPPEPPPDAPPYTAPLGERMRRADVSFSPDPTVLQQTG